jgi:hypothetical protein
LEQGFGRPAEPERPSGVEEGADVARIASELEHKTPEERRAFWLGFALHALEGNAAETAPADLRTKLAELIGVDLTTRKEWEASPGFQVRGVGANDRRSVTARQRAGAAAPLLGSPLRSTRSKESHPRTHAVNVVGLRRWGRDALLI